MTKCGKGEGGRFLPKIVWRHLWMAPNRNGKRKAKYFVVVSLFITIAWSTRSLFYDFVVVLTSLFSILFVFKADMKVNSAIGYKHTTIFVLQDELQTHHHINPTALSMSLSGLFVHRSSTFDFLQARDDQVALLGNSSLSWLTCLRSSGLAETTIRQDSHYHWFE